MSAAELDRLCAEAIARLTAQVNRSAAAHLGHMRKKWRESKPA